MAAQWIEAGTRAHEANDVVQYSGKQCGGGEATTKAHEAKDVRGGENNGRSVDRGRHKLYEESSS